MPTPSARRSDPETSHAAAASVRALRRNQLAVLRVIVLNTSLTDEVLAVRYKGPPQSPSGLRTRRNELVALGLVHDSGTRQALRSGRSGIIWAPTPAGVRLVAQAQDAV